MIAVHIERVSLCNGKRICQPVWLTSNLRNLFRSRVTGNSLLSSQLAASASGSRRAYKNVFVLYYH